MSTSRGRPPRGLCLAGGISDATMAHCSSVRSEGYAFRERSSCTICAHSSAVGRCANYLRNLLCCQVMFPDSLLQARGRSCLTAVSSGGAPSASGSSVLFTSRILLKHIAQACHTILHRHLRCLGFRQHSPRRLCYDGVASTHGGQAPGREEARWTLSRSWIRRSRSCASAAA